MIYACILYAYCICVKRNTIYAFFVMIILTSDVTLDLIPHYHNLRAFEDYCVSAICSLRIGKVKKEVRGSYKISMEFKEYYKYN